MQIDASYLTLSPLFRIHTVLEPRLTLSESCVTLAVVAAEVCSERFSPVLVTTYWLLPPAMFGTVIVPLLACESKLSELTKLSSTNILRAQNQDCLND